MLTMIVYYHCKKGFRNDFVKEIAAADIASKCQAENGCKQYDYFLPLNDDDTLLLVEKWESEEAQKIHMTTPHFQQLSSLKERYVERVGIEKILHD